ncbi:MAG: T9SS type A sorting domain-containing protein [Chitinophagaceae bacterium]
MKKFTLLFAISFLAILLFSNVGFSQAIQQRGNTETDGTSGTSLTINKPSGLAVGDVMIVNIAQADNDGNTLGNASRSGWILVRGGSYGSNSSNSWWGTVLYKVATASDVSSSSFSFTLDGDNDNAVGGLMAFYNVDASGGVGPNGSGTGPFDVAASSYNTDNSSTITASGITTSTNGSGIIMLGLIGDNKNFSDWSTTSPGSLSEILDYDRNIGGSADVTVGAAWARQSVAGATGNGTVTINSTEYNAGLLMALKPAHPAPPAPASANLWAASSSGTQISSFKVSNGYYFAGPNNIFTPSFPGTTTSATYTSAIGRTDKPTAANGYFYWIGNTTGNNGVVEIWGADATGGSPTRLGSLDMNGSSTSSLGFVRLGMDAQGNGWILAGNGSTLYLAKFVTSPTFSASVVDNNVTLVGGSVSTFQNGDLAISGTGNIYALANDGSGLTQLFLGMPNGSSTTLTKKWDLLDNNGNGFTGSVNGVAFDLSGSLYFSSSDGLYYIDANTVNGPAGTVETRFVKAVTGLHDLASNVFPTNSPLPVKLISFSGSIKNGVTNLKWETENAQNFSHFEVERSEDGSNFTSIATKNASGDIASKVAYSYDDNLTSFSGERSFFYRLKMVDLDGKYTYSNVILIRKGGATITGIRIVPNPLRQGSNVSIRFEAAESAIVHFNVVDISGRIVLRQQNRVEEGSNSVSLNNFNQLQSGTYILQMNDGRSVQSTKFIISQ